jgi:hypothetical protein
MASDIQQPGAEQKPGPSGPSDISHPAQNAAGSLGSGAKEPHKSAGVRGPLDTAAPNSTYTGSTMEGSAGERIVNDIEGVFAQGHVS